MHAVVAKGLNKRYVIEYQIDSVGKNTLYCFKEICFKI